MKAWMISNRQPWVEALVRGWITSKTRSATVNLPPKGATVYLHASKALWRDWQYLQWTDGMDVRNLPRGGVVAVARLAYVGPTEQTMPENDQEYFWLSDGWDGWSCADDMTMVFEDVVSLPFIPCRGAQVPTRKLPPELIRYLDERV